MRRFCTVVCVLLWCAGCATQPDAEAVADQTQVNKAKEAPWEGERLVIADQTNRPPL